MRTEAALPENKPSNQDAAWGLLDRIADTLGESDPRDLDLSVVARRALEHLSSHLSAARGSIYLLASPRTDDEGNWDEFELVHSIGADDLPRRVSFPTGHQNSYGLVERSRRTAIADPALPRAEHLDPAQSLMVVAAHRREPLFISNATEFREAEGLTPRSRNPMPAGDSCVVLPIHRDDRVLGVINLAAFDRPDRLNCEVHRCAICTATRWLGTCFASAEAILELRSRATRDGLTTLFNYTSFYDLLAREVLRSERFSSETSLILMDLDDFKRINDHYGHLAGDQILAELARRLNTALRGLDIPARYAGDEFAVILPQTGLAGANKVARRIHECIAASPFEYLTTDIPVTVSLGVAQLEAGMTAVDLVSRADEKLYKAKRDGRNCVRGG